MYNNKEIIDGLIHDDRKIISNIYKTQYPIVSGWIKKNSGSADDSQDIFHEAFLVIIRRIRAKGLSLEKGSFSTYLFAICKHLWYQELRNRSRVQRIEIQDFNEPMDSESYDELEEKKLQIFLDQINLLETKCRKLLLLYCEKKSLPEIMRIMGFKNTQAVADKKKNCRKKLIQNLLNNKEYKELQGEILINN
jgi:RNA polymerase sigma factor (sigma-70 family)